MPYLDWVMVQENCKYVVGGNVSLYNESDEFDTAILPTPSIGVVGTTNNVSGTPLSII
jgi:phosphoribosylformylglycinamidine synthase